MTAEEKCARKTLCTDDARSTLTYMIPVCKQLLYVCSTESYSLLLDGCFNDQLGRERQRSG